MDARCPSWCISCKVFSGGPKNSVKHRTSLTRCILKRLAEVGKKMWECTGKPEKEEIELVTSGLKGLRENPLAFFWGLEWGTWSSC